MKNNKRWCENRSSKSRLTFHCITVLCMPRDVHSGKRVRHVYDIFLHLMQLMLILSKLDLHLHVYTGISWFFFLDLGDLWEKHWFCHVICKRDMHIEYCNFKGTFILFIFIDQKQTGLQTSYNFVLLKGLLSKNIYYSVIVKLKKKGLNPGYFLKNNGVNILF